MNWSGTTTCRGANSSFSEPTAETERSCCTPSAFSAQMLARKLSSDGRMRWPRPWRGRKATRLPSSSPMTIASDGVPNGVSGVDLGLAREALHLVEAAAADDADLGVFLHPAPRDGAHPAYPARGQNRDTSADAHPAATRGTSALPVRGVHAVARRAAPLRGADEVPLIPRYFDLLVLLVERRHEAVHRREIMGAVWSDVVVSDSALTQAIRTIRRALDDDPREPRFIRTVSRHGYRFVGPTVEEDRRRRPPRRRGRIAGPRSRTRSAVLLKSRSAARRRLRGATRPRRSTRRARPRRWRGSTARPGHERARAYLRDARWDVPGAAAGAAVRRSGRGCGRSRSCSACACAGRAASPASAG